MEDMCYERLPAEAYVNQSAHRALMNAGDIKDVCLLLQYLLQCVCVYYCRT
jgi:hypothetical protein